MLFNSPEFALFFAVVTPAYFLLPYRHRWLLLLGASVVFYMAFVPAYVLILVFTIVIDYIAGLLIENASGRKRGWYLALSIVSNVAVLAVFKYYNFANANLGWLVGHWGGTNPLPYAHFILPIGLSFHTFQAMSYTIEVYRGNQRAERRFGIYALYVMFYPQLVAGPIERPQNMLPQFCKPHDFDGARASSGLRLMAWGLFKKVVIADRLAVTVNEVYNNPTQYHGAPLIVATVFFAFQIYCDFSGYSDIALGAAKVMGFTLMTNFDRPYLARSIDEFWKRWHISLSSWFRDYLYIPLGGSRVPRWRWQMNLLVTFVVSGLWHGANWTYVCWGALNGFYLIAALWTRAPREALAVRLGLHRFPGLTHACRVGVTFCLVCFAWIFFRANSISDALYVASHLFTGLGQQLRHPTVGTVPGLSLAGVAVAAAAVAALWAVEGAAQQEEFWDHMAQRSAPRRYLVYYTLAWSIVLFGVFTKSQFIYFQF